MPWSGGTYTRTNGTYTGTTVWAQDAAAAVKIQSSRHDTHDQDLASGINACLAKDGSNTCTILSLSGTVNSASGIIKVGSVSVFSIYGTQNTFLGSNAGNFTLTGAINTAVGDHSLSAITTGLGNSAFGVNALTAVTTSSSNTGVGSNALDACTTGSQNTALGSSSLLSVTTGGKNVGVGYMVDVPSATANGQLSIQNAIYGTGNTGTSSTVSTGNIGLYTTAPTARLHLPAGTATASTAPLKLTAGTNLTTPENGAFEFDGTSLYFTVGGVRKTVTLT